jgi:uncharacterized protein (TIGR02599 family)
MFLRRKWFVLGFTLVETLVSVFLLLLLLVIVASIVDSTSRSWRSGSARISQFRNSREAFDSITGQLSQATLNTYLDYDNPNAPTRYVRQSELRFISGPASLLLPGGNQLTHAIFFQLPGGLSDQVNLKNLLNTWGYFIEYGDDANIRPTVLQNLSPPVPLRTRFRLMELMQPSQSLTIYNYTSGAYGYTGKDWYQPSVLGSTTTRPVHVLAENVIALVFLPRFSEGEVSSGGTYQAGTVFPAYALAPNYLYDTTSELADPQLDPKNQLPPVLQVTLVAISEQSAIRMSSSDSANLQNELAGLFQDASKYQNDLNQTLEPYLIQRGIDYRIFSANVSIRGAKWSTEQAN